MRYLCAVWAVLLLLACQPPGQSRSDAVDQKTVVSGYIDNILNGNQWEDYDRYFSPQLEFNGALIGRSELERRVGAFRAAYPDFHMTIDEQIAEGDLVMTRMTCTGTHLGSDLGVPATGVKVRFTGIAIDRVQKGKVVQMRFLGDVWGRMQQIRTDL